MDTGKFIITALAAVIVAVAAGSIAFRPRYPVTPAR